MKKLGRLVVKLVDFIVSALYGNVALARRKGVTVGGECRVYIREFGAEPFLLTIGDRVTIAPGCRLITHDGSTGLVLDEDGQRFQHYAPISIGSDVFIGVNSVVLPGVTIGSRVVVGAGSVVTRDVPDDSVVLGNPARVVGTFGNFSDRVRKMYVCDTEVRSIADYRSRVMQCVELEASRLQSASAEDVA